MIAHYVLSARRRLASRPEILILVVLAALTRFWGILQPHAIVFDEVYFKSYAGDYLTGSYYFDPHPPLGKLLLGGFAHLLGLSGAAVTGSDPSTLLRLLPAFAGTLIIPVFYILLRQLKASRRIAFLGALLLLFDNALLVESRFILIDSMLILFGLSALSLYLAARRRRGVPHVAFLIASLILAGMAASTKWTGLSALGLIALAWFVETPALRQSWRRLVPEAILIVAIPALVYLSVFAVHFALLPKSGQGDAFMSAKFQRTLIGNPTYDPSVKMSLWEKFWDLNHAMRQSEASLRTATHPYGSPWFSWPLMERGVYYWQGDLLADQRQGNIYLLGNPVVWWGTLFAMIVTLLAYLERRHRFTHFRTPLLLLAVAYLANFLPFSRIDRVMFLYHYFYALCFSLAIGVIGLGVIAGWAGRDDHHFWHFPTRASAGVYVGIIVLAGISFLYFLPLSYGWPLSPAALQHHMWFPSWR